MLVTGSRFQKIPPNFPRVTGHTSAMIPPLNIPAIAPFRFVRFQNNANSVNGPKAPPNPAHAFSTSPNTELFSSIAIKIPDQCDHDRCDP